ncbi:glycoside hydrolase family 35 protein [Aaosphaeria arxii CBS 175.79]|uniref:Beta-galactosidase n=1 Tax=Aaosphaeria arxii CBS 175.79 TaxID=1450172 RepID=A0A6A5X849_9PLEO|nr:glycoside hydrolase family 35 protein [Aaosphaeria arxii CBS 175.79]KAF2009100.1 glycoside hydrolase family 35 protein [Aaosphaeria arxii CBS 175.79]
MKWTSLSHWLAATSLLSSVHGQNEWPVHDNGLNEVVQWDHYSVLVNGQRFFFWTGELHQWRIPVPELWEDILQKLKAAGFNGIAIYEHWGWHAPNNETLDFTSGAHNFLPIFDLAKKIGLYVVYRPGPYSNAESNGGGLPGWLTTGEYGALRDPDPRYTAEWSRYWEQVADLVKPHLVTNGGPVIMWQLENEYGHQFLDPDLKTPNQSAIDYMETLNDYTRGWGIDVPFTANNPNMWTRAWSKDYSNVGGEVDMYDISPTQPSFLMEFQGGAYNPWDGPAGGCLENMDATWVNLFFRHNIAQKVVAVNVYMAYGGTNWGNIAYPSVGTSYDYSAPVHENRLIGDKYSETKLFGLFMRVARDYAKVNRVGLSTAYSTDPSIFTTELRNPDTNGAFYVVRHDYSPSKEITQFRLHVTTSIGNQTVPQHGNITLNGTESKILVTDFPIGSSGKKLVYSTAEILTISDLHDRQVIVFWAPSGETGELLLKGAKEVEVKSGQDITFQTSTPDGLVVAFNVGETPGVLEFDNGVQAVIVDRQTAYRFWAPTLESNPFAWENQTVIVNGPDLIRDAKIEEDVLYLHGDWSIQRDVEIWAPSTVKKVHFNDKEIKVEETNYNSLAGVLEEAEATIESVQASLPGLTEWKVADGLPEAALDYDDSRWTDADHMTTSHPVPPDTYPVLFADEYGYQAGNLLWRGRFDATGTEVPSAVYLRVIGGLGFGWSAYLNGNFLGAWQGGMKNKTGDLTLEFRNTTLHKDQENVILVIQDTMGKEQREGALDPRGILNATLITAAGSPKNFTSWKIAGNAGGNHLLDPIKGTYNEGGLHAERLGWHLPGFDDSNWELGQPSDGFKGATARFYRTVVPLHLPKGYDISLAFELNHPTRAKLRAQLYVNGYQFGRIIPFFGNQIEFPVFPGILDYDGDNTIGLSIWALDEAGGAVDIQLKVLGVHRSSLDVFFDGEYLRPKWTDRSEYA